MAEYYTDDGKLYQESDGKYYYNVVMPNYLEFFRGDLYIWKSGKYNEKKYIELRIIPRIIGDNKYAVTIKNDSGVYGVAITKGLEFDTVFIVDEPFEPEDFHKQALYIEATRALHVLHIFAHAS